LADRWQYGNVPNSEMLDALEDLEGTADGQMAIAKTPAFKGLAGDIRDASATMYRSVNSGSNGPTAASQFLAVGDSFITVCGPLLDS
jgi:hypothetical protein